MSNIARCLILIWLDRLPLGVHFPILVSANSVSFNKTCHDTGNVMSVLIILQCWLKFAESIHESLLQSLRPIVDVYTSCMNWKNQAKENCLILSVVSGFRTAFKMVPFLIKFSLHMRIGSISMHLLMVLQDSVFSRSSS